MAAISTQRIIESQWLRVFVKGYHLGNTVLAAAGTTNTFLGKTEEQESVNHKITSHYNDVIMGAIATIKHFK